MTATFETLCQLDEQLVSKGHQPLTPWWKDKLRAFYAHDSAATLVARVGRGGAKSHTSVKISLNETLFGDWSVPPGERHYWAFISTNKDEAAQRLTLIERFLTDLGVGYDRRGDEIQLRDLPRGWRVMACQVGAVSGFRCYGASLDECAKYRNGDGANPAGEIAASINAMTVTHKGAKRLLISSPLGTQDYHAERFDLGDTAEQVTFQAASWEANPEGITKEQTIALEPDRRVWLREYAAIPQSQMGSAFDPDLVAEAFRPGINGDRWQAVGFCDPSSGGGDGWAWGIASYVQPPPPHSDLLVVFRGGIRIHPETKEPISLEPPPRLLTVHYVDSFEGRFKGLITSDQILDRVTATFRQYGVRTVFSDQRESFMLSHALMARGFRFVELPWTNNSKIESVRRLREHLAKRSLILPERAKLKKEMLGYAERITASGAITYSARGTGHDDEMALLMTLASAELEQLVPGSPLYAPNQRTEIPGA